MEGEVPIKPLGRHRRADDNTSRVSGAVMVDPAVGQIAPEMSSSEVIGLVFRASGRSWISIALAPQSMSRN